MEKKPLFWYSESCLKGVPLKNGILSSFEFLDLGGVFFGVKNNSKNFGSKKIGLNSKSSNKFGQTCTL